MKNGGKLVVNVNRKIFKKINSKKMIWIFYLAGIVRKMKKEQLKKSMVE